jgi:hypothetical protein
MDSLLPFLQGFCNPYNMPVYPGAPWLVGHSGQYPFLAEGTSRSSIRSPEMAENSREADFKGAICSR